jgi:hypothetical protein
MTLTMLTPEQLASMTPDQARKQLMTLLGDTFEMLTNTADGQASVLRGEAAQLLLQAAAKFDEADEKEHLGRLRDALSAFTEPIKAAYAAIESGEVRVTEAIAAERRAEDRVREAVENHRLAVEAEQAAQRDNATSAVQTDALMRMRAAADVTARARAAAEGAKTARDQADEAVVGARRVLTALEAGQAEAAAALRNPGLAPVSDVTGLLDGVRRLSQGGRLDGDAMNAARDGVREIAERTGVAKQLRREGANVALQELRDKQREMSLPNPGHPLRPANAGMTFVPHA